MKTPSPSSHPLPSLHPSSNTLLLPRGLAWSPVPHPSSLLWLRLLLWCRKSLSCLPDSPSLLSLRGECLHCPLPQPSHPPHSLSQALPPPPSPWTFYLWGIQSPHLGLTSQYPKAHGPEASPPPQPLGGGNPALPPWPLPLLGATTLASHSCSKQPSLSKSWSHHLCPAPFCGPQSPRRRWSLNSPAPSFPRPWLPHHPDHLQAQPHWPLPGL